MALFKSIASGMAGRRAGKMVARRIPNPLLRFAVVTAATTLAPMVFRKLQAASQRRKLARGDSQLTLDR
ncbi:MAG: hypothetical protein V4617_13915 [Gemmatimonadota bacterium]